MSKIRVHELAKELNKSSKDVIFALKGHGVLVESHMSTIPDESADKIRKFFTAPPVKKQEAPKAPANARKLPLPRGKGQLPDTPFPMLVQPCEADQSVPPSTPKEDTQAQSHYRYLHPSYSLASLANVPYLP